MQQLFITLIKFYKRVSQRWVEQQPASISAETVQQTERPNNLIQPTLRTSDRETLRLYKAMDLAG